MNNTLVKANEFSVEKGLTILYKRTKLRGKAIPHYAPFTLEDNAMLITIRQALLGDKRAQESEAFMRAHVRFGWIEAGFNSLNWMSVSELYHAYFAGTISKPEKRKLMELARLLFVSIKDIPKSNIKPDTYIRKHRRVA